VSKFGYHSRDYWEETYRASGDAVDDWLQTFDVLRPHIESAAQPADRVLIIGNGNSPLGEQMYDAGWHDIVCVDFSPTVTAAMAARAGGRPGLSYREMDVRRLAFDDASFDAVIDKGTLDAIICDPGAEVAVYETCAEVARVLGPRGVFLSISLAPPRRRLEHLVKPEWGWQPTLHTVPKTRVVQSDDPEAGLNFVYLMSRR
jgi:EEF1A lysine methyltransferase 4